MSIPPSSREPQPPLFPEGAPEGKPPRGIKRRIEEKADKVAQEKISEEQPPAKKPTIEAEAFIDYFQHLPEDMRQEILSHLPEKEIFQFQAVSKWAFSTQSVQEARAQVADLIAA